MSNPSKKETTIAIPDISKLGLRCGLEIHQQLGKKKLFCSCSSDALEQQRRATIRRKQQAVAGESGRVDVAAAMETARNRWYEYHAYAGESCLVDLDEEPPHAVDAEALSTALGVAKFLKLSVPPQLQIMRKTITNGSVCSAFQRTMLVGVENIQSVLTTPSGDVKIAQLCLEEEACKTVEEKHDHVIYSLSRQGIALLELSTGPDITTPEQAKEVAQKIGMLLRSFPAIKRGLGTIRQDVNVSIKGGARIEIKGAQDLQAIVALVEGEATRQYHLLQIVTDLHRVQCSTTHLTHTDVTTLFATSASKIVRGILDKQGHIGGMRLPRLAGFLGRTIQTDRRFGTELADHAKIAAGVSGLFHSDELPAYGITAEEVASVRNHLNCNTDDAFILVAGSPTQIQSAFAAVVRRLAMACEGVPSEVRKALPSGSSSFLRPMPGSARMYPETDLPPIRITPELLAQAPQPVLLEEKIKEFQVQGLAKDLADALGKSRFIDTYERSIRQFPQLKPAYIAEVLVGMQRQASRDIGEVKQRHPEEFMVLFKALAEGSLAKESVADVLAKVSVVTEAALSSFKALSDEEILKRISAVVVANKGLPMQSLVGKVMAELRGKAPGQKVVELLKQVHPGP